MHNLSLNEYQQLTVDSSILSCDEFGDKVLALNDQSIIKLFRVKRFISQATLYSPARRFARNVRCLKKIGIPTVTIIDLYKISDLKRTAVHYKPLKGLTVREYMQQHGTSPEFLEKFGIFLARMHNKGVFFRSAHFGNIVYTPEKEFGLIDVSDMSISPFSLGFFKRIRNLKHIFRVREDVDFILDSSIIEQSYLQHCPIKNAIFKHYFLQRIKYMKLNACN